MCSSPFENSGKLDRVAVDAAGPRSVFGVRRRLDALPDDAAAVYPGAEGDHAHPVTLAHPALGLDVGELVQQRAARHVPEPVQRHARRLHVAVGEDEPPLHLAQHPSPAGVDAEVLECPPERRPVALRSLAQELAPEGGEGHPEKLRRRQHGRGEGE